MDHPSSLQEVLPIPSYCPPGNSNQNVSVVPSSPPNSPEVTYQSKTKQVGSTVPEVSSRDPHPSSTSPQLMDPPSSSTSFYHSDSDWPIAIKKGTHSTHNPHPIYNFLSYHCLSPTYISFVILSSFYLF